MAGKKWCEYCRINLPYSKKAIEDHEATRQHLQNKQKAIQFQRIKVRKQKQQQKQAKHQVMLGTANIPKAKRGSQLDKQVSAYRDSVINEGKSAIHRLIAERTQGMYGAPIQYPQKQDLVLADNYQEEGNDDGQKQQTYEMWKIDICETTGQPCFINRITKLVLYQPPKGYLLSEQQKQQWQHLKKICEQKVQINPDATVNISQWQQDPDQQNYFQLNRVKQQEQADEQVNEGEPKQNIKVDYSKYITKKQQINQNQVQLKPKIKTWKQDLQEKLINNQISTNQVFQKFIQEEMKNSKTVKQKNDNLKKLIQSGIQIRTRPNDQLLEDQLNSLNQVKIQEKTKILFKPRKKVHISQDKTKINQEKDIF